MRVDFSGEWEGGIACWVGKLKKVCLWVEKDDGMEKACLGIGLGKHRGGYHELGVFIFFVVG